MESQDMTEGQEVAAALREIAAILEDMEGPVGIQFRSRNSSIHYTKEPMIAFVKTFRNVDKTDGITADYLRLTREFGPISVSVECPRHVTCVTRKVYKMVEVDEWDCESLLKPEDIADHDPNFEPGLANYADKHGE